MAVGLENPVAAFKYQFVAAPFPLLDPPGGPALQLNPVCVGRIKRPVTRGVNLLVIHNDVFLRGEALQAMLAHGRPQDQPARGGVQVRARDAHVPLVNPLARRLRVLEPVGGNVQGGPRRRGRGGQGSAAGRPEQLRPQPRMDAIGYQQRRVGLLPGESFPGDGEPVVRRPHVERSRRADGALLRIINTFGRLDHQLALAGRGEGLAPGLGHHDAPIRLALRPSAFEERFHLQIMRRGMILRQLERLPPRHRLRALLPGRLRQGGGQRGQPEHGAYADSPVHHRTAE